MSARYVQILCVCVCVGRNGVHVMSVCVGWVAVGGGGCLFVCNGWFE